MTPSAAMRKQSGSRSETLPTKRINEVRQQAGQILSGLLSYPMPLRVPTSHSLPVTFPAGQMAFARFVPPPQPMSAASVSAGERNAENPGLPRMRGRHTSGRRQCFHKYLVLPVRNQPKATSSTIITLKPTAKNTVPTSECFPSDISGISSTTTT